MTEFDPGQYQATLVGGETGTTSTETAYVKVNFAVGDSTRSVYLYLSDGAWPYTEKKLKYLGFDGDFDNPGFSKAGEMLAINCKHEEHQGKVREKWDFYAAEPIADDFKKRLSAQWRANNGAPPPKSSPPAAKPASAPPPPTAKAEDEPQTTATAGCPTVATRDECWKFFLHYTGQTDAQMPSSNDWEKAVQHVVDSTKHFSYETFEAADWQATAEHIFKHAVPF